MDFSNEKIVGKIVQISNDDILPNRFQPRKYFDEEETLELAESIKEHGILQPIVVRQVGDKYEIIAGERRFKANILAGNDSIKAIISNLNDKDSSEIAIIENIQRQDLTPIEEAISYKHIIDMGYVTQEELARKIGKSQSTIANKIRLLKLSDNVQDALMEKKISERHARSLLQLNSLKQQDELLEKIIKERLTVRKTDEEIGKMNSNEINNQSLSNMTNIPNVGVNQVPIVEETPEIKPIENQTPIVDTVTVEPPVNQENIINTPQEPVATVSPIMGTPIANLNNNPIPIVDEKPVDVAPEEPTPISPIENINTQIPQQEEKADIVQSTPNIFNQGINQEVKPIDNTPLSTPIETSVATPKVNQDSLVSNIFTSTPTNPVDMSESNNDEIKPIEPTVQPVEPITEQTPIDSQNTDMNIPSSFNIPTSIENTTVPTPPSPEPINIEPVTNNIENDEFSIKEEDIPTFVPEQMNENTPSSPIVDISDNKIEEIPNDDIPLNSTIESPIENQPTPIIVTNDETQYDPIMPEQASNEPTLDFKTIINLIRQCSSTIEKCGYKIDTEEYDLEGKYQVTFIIEK